MAEIAIPAVALGAMYIISNQKEKSSKKEKYQNNKDLICAIIEASV